MSELRQVNQAVDELRKIYAENGNEFKSFSAEHKEKSDRIEKVLEQQEEKNQKLLLQIESSKAKSEELESKYLDLEKQIIGIPSSKSSEFKSCEKEIKSLEKYLKVGKQMMGSDELKYLRTDNNVDGGFLASNEMDNLIIKYRTETSAVRSIARVKSIGKKALEVPVRTSIISGGFAGQNELNTLSNSKYGLGVIPAERLTVTAQISMEEMQDADFNMESEVMTDVSESFTQIEGRKFVKGLGAALNEPEGLNTTAAGIAEINSGIANGITLNNLLQLQGELKAGYNPMFGMNRRTIATLRQAVGGDGQYLWVVGNIAAGIPNTFSGDPYVSLIDMDDIAANSYPIIYADFKSLYTIVDRSGLAVIRDEVTGARQAMINLTFHKRVGGRVVNPEAGVRLKVSV